MLVTHIEDINAKRCRVYLDNSEKFVLYKSELRKLDVCLNKEISPEQYNYIRNEILTKRAIRYALNILLKQERTKYQLIDKLKKSEYQDDIIDKVILYVEDYNYINDKRYANQFIRCGYKKKSRQQLILALQRRGIDKETAKEAYDIVNKECNIDEYENELLKKLILKRVGNRTCLEDKEIQRLYRYLLSKGFAYSDISRYMRQRETL